MTRKRLIALTVAAFSLAGTQAGWGQEAGPAEPSDTEIVIPEFVLRVEELGVDEVEAVLPSQADLALGLIRVPLPDAGELVVSDLAFTAPLPGGAVSSAGPTVFSTGRLGAGTANRIVGELSIYKLGDDPRFRLGFTHEGLDGYQFNSAGSGFYSFTNTIDAWLSAQRPKMEFEVGASFAEHEDGLQDQSEYNAVSIRATDARGEVVYRPDPLVTISADIEAGLATRRQTASGSTEVPRDQEYVLRPAVGARIDIRSLDLLFTTSYYLRALAGDAVAAQNDVDFTAGFEFTFPRSVVLAGHAGVHYDFTSGLQYPLALSIETLIGDGLELGFGGGFRVDRVRFMDLWVMDPLTAVGDAEGPAELLNNDVWFAAVDARWAGAAGLSLRSDLTFTYESATVDLQPFDATVDQFPYLHQSEFMRLATSLDAAWQPSPVWQFEAGLAGSVLDRTTIEPQASVDGAVRFADRSGLIRADLEFRSSFYPEPDIPWIGFEGTVNAGEGVEIVLELSDLLAPIYDSGRPRHLSAVTAGYPFVQPGFVATILTRITL